MAVNKADIVDEIAAGTGLTKIETEAVVNGFMTTVKSALERGDRVELRGFGSFDVQYRKARMARNPHTQEKVHVEAYYAPVFRPAKDLRQKVDASHKARE